MPTNTVNWQEVLMAVEKLSWPDQLRLVAELLLRMQQKVAANEPVDLLELAGVGAEVWIGMDTDAYLNEERDSWQT
jgi:hypothetical protein